MLNIFHTHSDNLVLCLHFFLDLHILLKKVPLCPKDYIISLSTTPLKKIIVVTLAVLFLLHVDPRINDNYSIAIDYKFRE